jgi:quinol monooxygenase YgiN
MIVLLVHMTVKPGKAEECIELLKAVAAESSKEPGCLQYMAHQSAENPLTFVFYERYKDEAAFEAHRNSPHFARYVAGGIGPLVEAVTREMLVPVS